MRNNLAPRWLNDEQWVCFKHLPSARIPASQERCWYSCGSVRPDKPTLALVEPAPTVVIKVAPPKVAPPKVAKVVPQVVAKVAPPPPLVLAAPVAKPRAPTSPPDLVQPLSSPGPTPQERRRGATHPVGCLMCGVILWRRKKDVADGVRPFCSPAHRGAYDAQGHATT